MEKKAAQVLLGTQVPLKQVNASTPDELLSTKQAGNDTPAGTNLTFGVRARSMEETTSQC